MKSTTKWALGLTVLLAALLQQPMAWGQLRIHSGALKSGAEHPKALEKRIFQLTNEARRKNGLPSLDLDNRLTDLAREKGDEMIKSHFFNQVDSRAKKPPTDYGKEEPAKIRLGGKPGENVLMGSKDDYSDVETAARLIVNCFMGSPGPRSNVLNPAFTYLGVGASIKGKESYIIQKFGQKEMRYPDILQKIRQK